MVEDLEPGEGRLYRTAWVASYAEVDSTVLNDQRTVDGHALDLQTELIERYAR